MGLFQNSAFAHPVPSFPKPIPVPASDPDVGPFANIQVSCAWLPYIRGALQQLTLQSTWRGDLAAVNLAQERANLLITLFNGTNPCDCGAPCPQVGAGECCDGDCCMGCIRVDQNCNVFIKCPDGSEVQLVTSATPGAQPGNGTPQPKPGGGTQMYDACFDASGAWFLPTLVNTGDVIVVTSTNGSWNDPDRDPGIWRCPTGEEFIAGACVPFTEVLVATDPLPLINHMALVVIINGVFYSVLPGPFTVPGGITNASVVFVGNDSNRLDNQGNVCFKVQVQNNAPTAWSHTFDFATSSLGWNPVPSGGGDLAVYIPGTGWGSVQNVLAINDTDLDIESPVIPATTITRVEVFYSADSDNSFGAARSVTYNPGAALYGNLETGAGTFDTIITNTVAGITQLLVHVDRAQPPTSGNYRVTKVIVAGSGTDPF